MATDFITSKFDTSTFETAVQARKIPLDQVFRNYDSQQAAAYAAHRSRAGYASDLYRVLLDHFMISGGHFNALLDVGCGTGEITRKLGGFFEHATGVDHSQEMIQQAYSELGFTKSGNKIQYEVGNAEQLEKLHSVKPASVDLLTVGMAVSKLRNSSIALPESLTYV